MKLFLSKNKESGFTLVETLVAVAIFSVSIAAVISVTANGISSTTASKNRLSANYLAQENIEYVRHLRNKYTPVAGVTASWNSFIDLALSCTSAGRGCVTADPAIETPPQELIPCTRPDCEDFPVEYDSNGYYFQPGGTDSNTPFLRYLTIDTISPNEIRVTSYVVWTEKNGGDKNITLTETLSNWIPTGN
ncbi:MAG: prepilin-type N-terminal cleavage/methylation domain-containing protein [Candidatus Pacebacteria bacterium]|nr:prepilin-type N-terminal cleavage/methylation domain-containing protein [Candidatus Paceibacterota bacterium]